jgi:hypothetical protein
MADLVKIMLRGDTSSPGFYGWPINLDRGSALATHEVVMMCLLVTLAIQSLTVIA